MLTQLALQSRLRSHITLTKTEIMQGALVGVMRQVQNLRDNRQPAYGATTDHDWQWHIEGALGEMALAKALGVFWAGVGLFRGADVVNENVRTRSKHSYDLILHPSDPDDWKYWLLTGCNGTYIIQGWCWGVDGKIDEYWQDPAGGRPAYFVPQAALTPL